MKQNGKDLLVNPPEKVILMYQAVNNMINEGCDINTIKVVDITSRAGIGKGTAYEYFATKEEIITKALLYEIMSYLEIMNKIAESNDSFQQKVYKLLDFGVEHYNEGRTFFQILKIVLGAYDISDALKKEFKQIQEDNICSKFERILDTIIQAGIHEQVIRETNVTLQRMVVNSQMIAFTMYLHDIVIKGPQDKTIEDVKKFIYDSIVKLLG